MEKGYSRRDILKIAGAFAAANILGGSAHGEDRTDSGQPATEPGVKPLEKSRVKVCRETTEEKSLLEAACESKISDPAERLHFIEGMRSSPEFGFLAEKLRSHIKPHNGEIRLLYPGAGSHIAPLEMALKFLEDEEINKVELTYNEINPEAVAHLDANLKNLVKIRPDINLEPSPKIIKHPPDGIETDFVLRKGDKTIVIKFLFKCSKKHRFDHFEWFRPTDLQRADAMIIHDVGANFIPNVIPLLEQYLRDTGGRQIPIVMEDYTRVYKYPERSESPLERRYDLELLGQIERGEFRYGHAEERMMGIGEDGPFTEADSAQVCKNGVVLVPYSETTRAGEKAADVAIFQMYDEARVFNYDHFDLNGKIVPYFKRFERIGKDFGSLWVLRTVLTSFSEVRNWANNLMGYSSYKSEKNKIEAMSRKIKQLTSLLPKSFISQFPECEELL